MKLLLSQPFSLEIPRHDETVEVLTGTFSPLSKKQLKKFKDSFKKDEKLTSEIRKLNRKLVRLRESDKDNLDAIYKIEDDIETATLALSLLDTEEATSKMRFNLSVQSSDLDRIVEICDILGYKVVLETIIRDVEEKKGNGLPG